MSHGIPGFIAESFKWVLIVEKGFLTFLETGLRAPSWEASWTAHKSQASGGQETTAEEN